jgi:beta-glucanase (GH16 family)
MKKQTRYSFVICPALCIFVLCLTGCLNVKKPGSPAGKPETSKTLVWSDEFNYSGLPDSNKWSYDTAGNSGGWGNNEAQFYTKARLANTEVKNGYLYINALKEDYKGFKYTSARLVTRLKGDWLYGRFEIKARLP